MKMLIKQVNVQHFIKEQSSINFDLLRSATTNESGQEDDVNFVIDTFNQIPNYLIKHKRIMPLLNAKAKKLKFFNLLTQETQQVLKTEVQQGIIKELAAERQLTLIIDVLSNENIPIILLKGAAFSGTIYSKCAPRTSNDLDILVKKEHWDKVLCAIENVMDYTEKDQPDVFGDLYEISFKPKNKIGVALDLHSSLVHPYLFDINEAELWHQSKVYPVLNNKNVRMLSPEHALIHQALHGYKDMDFAKYNLVDSNEIINQLQPDGALLIDVANNWGASIPLFVLLINCKIIMNSNVSQEIIDKLRPNIFTIKMVQLLLRSKFTQPVNNKKTIRYRVNQVLSHFIFTGSIKRPLLLQWLFIKSVFKLTDNMT